VMLSAESAAGKYPVESVQMMARISLAVESGTQFMGHVRHSVRPHRLHAIGSAVQSMAGELRAALIVVLTTTGRSANLVSQLRPASPILACTEDELVARRLSLAWGVCPIVTPFQRTTEAMISFLDRDLVRRRLVRPGDGLIIVGSVPLIARGRTNFVQVHRVPRSGDPGP